MEKAPFWLRQQVYCELLRAEQTNTHGVIRRCPTEALSLIYSLALDIAAQYADLPQVKPEDPQRKMVTRT